jgi:hypothetical protein
VSFCTCKERLNSSSLITMMKETVLPPSMDSVMSSFSCMGSSLPTLSHSPFLSPTQTHDVGEDSRIVDVLSSSMASAMLALSCLGLPLPMLYQLLVQTHGEGEDSRIVHVLSSSMASVMSAFSCMGSPLPMWYQSQAQTRGDDEDIVDELCFSPPIISKTWKLPMLSGVVSKSVQSVDNICRL